MEEENHSISHAHDKFFKESFSRKEIASSFIEEYFPSPVSKKLDLETLAILKDSFIDKELSEHFSDMLYSVQFRGKKTFIYLLFEHKSKKDNWVGFQLLRNMVKIWEQYLKQNKNAEFLPYILPAVIYHGELVWNIKEAIGHLFEYNENMRDYIPEFKIEMYDIAKIPPEDIRGKDLLRVYLTVLNRFIKDHKHRKIFKLFLNIPNEKTKFEYIKTVLIYLGTLYKGKEELENDLKEEFFNVINQGDCKMIALFEDIKKIGKNEGIEEGIEKGIEKGIEEGKLETARKMLDGGLSVNQIMTFTGLSREKIENLQKVPT